MRATSVVRSDISVPELLNDGGSLNELQQALESGSVVVLKSGISLDVLSSFREYLFHLKRASFARFVERVHGAPNHIRYSWKNSKQDVPADFVSWSFFPWNEDPFELFDLFRPLFELRNVLANQARDAFLNDADDKFTSRIAAQFYPSGRGFMHAHQDPVSYHQVAIPTVSLSHFGEDFHSGGVWMLNQDDEKIFLDPSLEFGDLTLFHTRIPHGVDIVDADSEYVPYSEKGRLMFIAAVNALAGATGVEAKADVAR